jgi:membrane-bound lytic murein transglycosylase D
MVALALGLGSVSGLSGQGKTTREKLELFPVNGLEGRVLFWEQVFTVYGGNDALIHDRDDVDLVYEAVRLEGDWEHDTAVRKSQRTVIQGRLGHWQSRLNYLSSRVAAGAKLAEEDQALRAMIEQRRGHGVSAREIRDLADGLHVQRGIRERFLEGWTRSGRYLPHMEKIFTEMNVPREILAIPLFESGFHSESKSRKGATGVWQFIRSTGRLFLRIDRHFDERLDPLLSTRGAGRFLLDAYSTLGSWPLAVMAYNHGTYGIQNARRRIGEDPMTIIRYYSGRKFGYASRNYYPEFLAALRIMENPERHFPGVQIEPAWSFAQVVLKQRTDVAAAMRQYHLDRETFLAYNPAVLPGSVRRGIMLPAGFPLRLPSPDPAGKPATPVPATVKATPSPPQPDAKRPTAPASTAAGKTAARPVVHTVLANDTLYSLARRYGTTVAALRRLNNLPDDKIRIGQKLLIFP